MGRTQSNEWTDRIQVGGAPVTVARSGVNAFLGWARLAVHRGEPEALGALADRSTDRRSPDADAPSVGGRNWFAAPPPGELELDGAGVMNGRMLADVFDHVRRHGGVGLDQGDGGQRPAVFARRVAGGGSLAGSFLTA